MVIHLIGPDAVETDASVRGDHEVEHGRKRPASGIDGGQRFVRNAFGRAVCFRDKPARRMWL